MKDVSVMVDDTKFNFRVACILENNNRVLLHKSNKENFWNIPGGRIKAGETSLCAIKREMEEELNIKLKSPKLIHISENFFVYANTKYHEILIVYHDKIENNEIINKQDFLALDNPNFTYRWFKKDEVKNVFCLPEIIYELIYQSSNTITHKIEK